VRHPVLLTYAEGLTMTQQDQDFEGFEIAVLQERLRQARHSFNMALVSATACGLAGLVGIVLTLSGRVAEGSLMATGGLGPIGACVQCAKDANDRLDRIFEEISED
jgi:hypothetical protein